MPGFIQGFALIVGVSSYPNLRPLPPTVLRDAGDIYHLLTASNQGGYTPDHIRLLLDRQATAAELRFGLEWLAASTGPRDTVLFYFSGHGGRFLSGPFSGHYLLPFDCNPADFGQTAISGDELTSRLRSIQAGRLLAFFDCCYAGGTGEVKEATLQPESFEDGFPESYYERLAQGAGRVIMASSRSDEVSLILPGKPNSLFTQALLEALGGEARTRGDGLVRVFDVFEYISEVVPLQGNQHPIFKASDLENNFPIALSPEGQSTAAVGMVASVNGKVINKRGLRQAISQAFSLEELEVLCADVQQSLADSGVQLPVSLEMVGGTEKSARIMKLIEYLDRRGHLESLISVIRRERPDILF
jgi:hypothetical protein